MTTRKIQYASAFLLLVAAIYSCDSLIPEAPAESDLLDGPTEGLTTSQQSRFLKGDIAFNDEVFTPESGLGPVFVANSCGSCHAGDGKGHPFTTLTRFGQTQPNTAPDRSIGGPQLQNRAIPGFEPETIPSGVPSMDFTPPSVTGLGFLAALTDQQILDNADPNDDDGDGISGVPTDPEVSDQTVRDVVFYLRTLKAPIQRDRNDPEVIRGKEVFMSISCSSCHTPSFTTPQSDIEALSNKTIFPYSDLLLHDMGPELDDGATEGSAETFEWRTPPLWGIGLVPESQGGEFFLMHDGRAKSIEEAIIFHGGEAEMAKQKFLQLAESDKKFLIKFLESL